MTSRGTTESRPGEPGYSDRGQGSITPPDRNQRSGGSSGSSQPDNQLTEEQQAAIDVLIGGSTGPEPEGPDTLADYTEPNPFGWVDVVSGEVVNSLSAWAKSAGYPNSFVKQVYGTHAPQMFNEIERRFLTHTGHPTDPDQRGYYTGTAEGLQAMSEWAVNWFGGQTGIPLTRAPRGGGGRGRGRGRRGPSGPTAEDIRNRFDVQELTNGVNEMWRAVLFEENPKAKKLATEYVDAIVASKGEKKIDFATFVEERLEKTSRFKSIYRSKPEHLSPLEYMAPYMNAARQMVAPDDADDIAIEGAQFGAAPQDFMGRLEREDSVTGSAPYINGLEARLSNLNKIFAGS